MQLAEAGAEFLRPHLSDGDGALLSTYGMLFLAGSMASSRSGDRAMTRSYLSEAEATATRLGLDCNYLWTAFGPTNVAIHRVNTAMELGDVQVALDLGPDLDTRALPAERRVRYLLDVARAYSSVKRLDAALFTMLSTEQLGPAQVRHHYLSRHLVEKLVQNSRGRPCLELDRLARRIQVVG